MDTLRIVLLGKTGAGKSSCGNTILNEELFLTKYLPNSVTEKCESKKKSINGKEIMVVDTPGFYDTNLPGEKLNTEILRCITECSPGPHVFMIVLKVDRYTEQEKETVRKITNSFGEEALKHTVVLFTHGDQLSDHQTIEDFVRESVELQELVYKCGGRVHVFDNKYWNQQQMGYRSNRVQVENLLNIIEEMVRENGGKYYSNDMMEKVNMTKQTGLSVRLVGVGTGVLLGAFLGVAGALAAVLAIISEFPSMPKSPQVMLGVVGASAVAGVVMGGGIGYTAAEGAETVTEAGTRTAEKMYETATNVVKMCENVITAVNKHKSVKMN